MKYFNSSKVAQFIIEQTLGIKSKNTYYWNKKWLNINFLEKVVLKDIKNAQLLIKLIYEAKPKNFLEVGILEGATSRNICEALNDIHNQSFTFIGIDLFGEDEVLNNTKEYTPISKKISNPLKWIYFKLILKMDPNSKKCVEHLLRKFKNSIQLYKGYSKNILRQIDLAKIDFVFLDGGHSYETVKEDLNILTSKLKKTL